MADDLVGHVELRWLRRRVPEQPTFGTETVLQYRVFRTHRIEHDAVPLATWADGYGWSDWMDVPVEVEE